MKRAYKIIFLTLSLVLILICSVMPVFAEANADGEAKEIKEFLVEETYVDENGRLIYVLEDGRKYDPATQQFIEEEIEGMKLSIDFNRCVSSLQYMWKGMLCIFVVMAVIILSVYGMNGLFSKLEEKKKQKEANGNNE